MDLSGSKVRHTVSIKHLISGCRAEEQGCICQYDILTVTNDAICHRIQCTQEICRKCSLGKLVRCTVIIVNPRGVSRRRCPSLALIANPILSRLWSNRLSLCNQISRSTAIQRIGCGCGKLYKINITKLHIINVFLSFCKTRKCCGLFGIVVIYLLCHSVCIFVIEVRILGGQLIN